MQMQTDVLSAAARAVLELGAGRAYEALVVKGPGNVEARGELEELKAQQLFDRPVKSVADAEAALAGLWLWHDWLEQSHTIAQGIAGETGSFWHAIMHRRQGDFSNAKHWYARCRNHPMLAVIGVQAGSLLNPLPLDKGLARLILRGWDPEHFVDLVEEAQGKENPGREAVLVSLQRLEWRLLFEHCGRKAVEGR